MAKVFGMHRIALRPGVNGEDFEQFFRDAAPRVPVVPGWIWHLLKGDKGDRAGRYLLLAEIESTEARDRYAAPSGELTPEGEQFFQAAAAVFEQWGTLASGPNDPAFTDYVVVAAWGPSLD